MIPDHPGDRAEGAGGLARLRSVAVRARRAVGRRAGGGHRGRAGRADGAGVPRLAAQHADRDHLDPAVDPDRDRRAQARRPDDQHDDARRPRARGRHAGRRRHRRDREHPSQPRDAASRCWSRSSTARRKSPTPTFVGTLSICIVFFPVVLLSGVAKFLFTPLALAVVFAMLTSYLLSRTLVTTMARYLLPDDHEEHLGHGRWGASSRAFDRGFERLRDATATRLATFIARRGLALACVAADRGVRSDCCRRGRGFLPGGRRRHDEAARARADRDAHREDRAHRRRHRAHHPRDHSGRTSSTSISDNIGLPISYNLAFYQTDSIGPQDADVLIQLQPKHRPTAVYQERIRDALAAKFPQ